MQYHFEAKIYQSGINWCVDVPYEITHQLEPKKGYIKVKGTINGYAFSKNLVPVKRDPYRLFVNQEMMKGGKTALGELARFSIEQDDSKESREYGLPEVLLVRLKADNLQSDWDRLTSSRKKDILKYLHYIKTEKALQNNIEKLIGQLKEKKKNIRIP